MSTLPLDGFNIHWIFLHVQRLWEQAGSLQFVYGYASYSRVPKKLEVLHIFGTTNLQVLAELKNINGFGIKLKLIYRVIELDLKELNICRYCWEFCDLLPSAEMRPSTLHLEVNCKLEAEVAAVEVASYVLQTLWRKFLLYFLLQFHQL